MGLPTPTDNLILSMPRRYCGTSCATCCAVLLEPQLLDIMIVQFRNEKVNNHGSRPITIDCNVVAFIVFEEGFHQPIKRTKHESKVDTVERRLSEAIETGHRSDTRLFG
ncbi:hypothetical protein TNCV_3939211 [Trichonephila clavipes]|nr:hypothetical protein TNCV_3939211 [Trichonephila clavipes]